MKKKVLELFCGKKSISKAFENKRYETTTLDIDKQFNPDICKDLMDVRVIIGKSDYRKL